MKFFFQSLKIYFKRLDWVLFFMGVSAAVFGLFVIFSATRSMASGDKNMLIQSLCLGIGVLSFFLLNLIDFERISGIWVFILIFNILFQVSLLVIGTGGDSTGNNSWIRFGPIGIQPGEIGKLLFIFTFAKHLTICGDKMNKPTNILLLLLHAGSVMGSVFIISKDLGVAISYLLITLVMVFVGGVSFKWLIPMIVGGACTFPFIWNKVLKDYQKLRILVVFDPSISPERAYHALQSKISIGAGGFWGMGYLQGRQSQHPTLLPAKHTDFIFAVAAEELGFVGAGSIIALLCSIVLKIYYNASRMVTPFAMLSCVGLGTMFMVQILINVGMCLGIAPVIGVTLPFFSYGGTSLVTCFLGLGFASSLRLHNRPQWLRRD